MIADAPTISTLAGMRLEVVEPGTVCLCPRTLQPFTVTDDACVVGHDAVFVTRTVYDRIAEKIDG